MYSNPIATLFLQLSTKSFNFQDLQILICVPIIPRSMNKTAAHSATSINKTNSTQTVNTLQFGRTYLGTGWRIILPVVISVAFGAFGDTRFGSKPWLTLIGLVVGFMVAGLLVKRQVPDGGVVTKKR